VSAVIADLRILQDVERNATVSDGRSPASSGPPSPGAGGSGTPPGPDYLAGRIADWVTIPGQYP
jgi:hypothetical protein